jgi:ribonuclease VapC
MILDTSAIVAAIANEPDGSRFQDAMLGAGAVAISSVIVLETRIVLQSRHGAEAVREFDEMLEQAGIVVVPFDAEMAEVAFQAFCRYGKGRGHPAQLNIVDCAAYALAKSRSEPLLFKGNDFEMTDIEAAS